MSKGRDFLVYLAGPIAGLTWGEGQSWRDYVAENLPVEIRAMSPLRGKEKLFKTGEIIGNAGYFNPLSSDDGITTRDRNDCLRAEAVIFNFLGADKVSIGTCMELGWADGARIPIIMVIEDSGNVHDHPMVRSVAGFRVNNLDDGIKLLEHLLMPEGRGTAREIIPKLAPESLGATHTSEQPGLWPNYSSTVELARHLVPGEYP